MMRLETMTICGKDKPDSAYGTVMTLIYQVSTLAFKGRLEPIDD